MPLHWPITSKSLFSLLSSHGSPKPPSPFTHTPVALPSQFPAFMCYIFTSATRMVLWSIHHIVSLLLKMTWFLHYQVFKSTSFLTSFSVPWITKKWPIVILRLNSKYLSDLYAMDLTLLSIWILCKDLLCSPRFRYWPSFTAWDSPVTRHFMPSACPLSFTHKAYLPSVLVWNLSPLSSQFKCHFLH